MASVSTCFTFHALARANPRNPPKTSSRNPDLNPKLKSRSTGHKSRRPSASSGGGDATTFSRLPPKEDFLSPSIDSLLRLSTEVKLSESPVVVNREAEKGVHSEIEASSDESEGEESGADDRKLGFDLEKFEVFDGDHGSGEDGSGLEFEGFENGFEGFAEGEEAKGKDKGVPAVMRCFDRAKIFVKAGDGGNGVVAFRREKFVPFGGPSGSDGGTGGNVYVEVDGSMNSLLPFRNSIHFRAGRGRHGQGRMQGGAKGEDVVVKVAPGTVIREARVEGMVLLELLQPGQRALLLPGGRGGKGNASFKTGTNKAPKIAENGEEGPEM